MKSTHGQHVRRFRVPRAQVMSAGKAARLQNWAHIATIIASAAAILALIFGSYQFYVTLNAQRESLDMQRIAQASDQHAKASEFYTRFVELEMEPFIPGSQQEKDDRRFVKAQKALALLNAINGISKSNPDGREIVFWSVQHYYPIRWAVENRRVTCLALTPDFQQIVEQLTETDKKMCRDINESN